MFATLSTRRGFTLVELLVVIGIIALLISILLPSLNRARQSAASTVNLSNLRQLGTGLEFYRNDNNGIFPTHSSLKSLTTDATPPTPRVRWADRIYPYLESTDVFVSPLLGEQGRLTAMKPWAHTIKTVGNMLDETDVAYYGGYGYNYQYLGNARVKVGNNGPFYAATGRVRAAAETVAIADTKGSRDGDDTFDYDEGTYVIDPPLQSFSLGSLGSREGSADPAGPDNYGYTGGDGSAGTLVPEHRATPDERNGNGDKVAAVFVDGHGLLLPLSKLDDFDEDGNVDNGYWNGRGDPLLR